MVRYGENADGEKDEGCHEEAHKERGTYLAVERRTKGDVSEKA